MDPLLALLAAAVGYFCGAVSFARVVTRIVAPEKDITQREFTIPGIEETFQVGTVGATAVATEVGRKFGCLASILDMLKVTVPTLAFKIWHPEASYFLIVAAMGVIGHNWPLYHRFRGGSGMSPIFGGMFVIDWIAVFVTSLGGMVLGLAVFKDFLMVYASGVLLIIPWLWFRTHDWGHVAYGIVINIAFWGSQSPMLKKYIQLKREGKVNLSMAMQTSDMGRGMLKMATRLGLVKSDKA